MREQGPAPNDVAESSAEPLASKQTPSTPPHELTFRERAASVLRSITQGAPSALWGLLFACGLPGLDGGLLCSFLGVAGGAVRFGRARSPRAAVGEGLWFGLAAFPVAAIGTLRWTLIVPTAIALSATLTFSIALALWAFAAARREQSWQSFALLTFAWALWAEVLPHLGLPSSLLLLTPATLTTAPWLLHGARLVGVTTIEGLLCAAAVAAALSWIGPLSLRDRVAQAGRRVGALFGVVVVLALLAERTASPSSGAIQVGVAQLNVEPLYMSARLSRPSSMRSFESHLERVLGELNGVDLVVLPEGHDGAYGWMLPEVRAHWQQRAKRLDQGVVYSTYFVEPSGKTSNAAVVVDRDGRVAGVHKKVELAFKGEAALEAGHFARPIAALNGVGVGVLICNETVSGTLPRQLSEQGATLIVVPTNDVSFGSSVMTFGHLAVSRLFAIETGRSLVWASNAGPSGVIDRWGALSVEAPLREPAAVRSLAELHDDVTPAVQLRTYRLALYALLVGLLILAELGAPATSPRETAAPSQRKRLALALCALVLAPSFAFFSPALVELRQGRQERAGLALWEPYAGVTTLPMGAESRALFGAPREQSGPAAVRYWLAFLGELDPARPFTSNARTLDELGASLRSHGIETTPRPLDANALPRVPVLVQERSGGFAVLSQPEGEEVEYFSPVSGSETLTVAEGLERTTGVGLLIR